MAGTSIDSLQIDLTLNIDAFKRKAEEAKSTLSTMFTTAQKDAERLSEGVAKLSNSWSTLSKADLSKAVQSLKSMSGVPKQLIEQFDSLEAVIRRTNTDSFTDKDVSRINAYFSSIQDTIKAYIQSETSFYESSVAAIEDQVKRREQIEVDASARAKEAVEEKVKAEEDGISRVNRDLNFYKENLEEVIRQYNVLRSLQDATGEKLSDAREYLETIKSSAFEKVFGPNNIPVDVLTGKGILDDSSSLSGDILTKVREENAAIDEQKKYVDSLEKQYQSLEKKATQAYSKINSLSRTTSKAQERVDDSTAKLLKQREAEMAAVAAAEQAAQDRVRLKQEEAAKVEAAEKAEQDARLKTEEVIRQAQEKLNTNAAASESATTKYTAALQQQAIVEKELAELKEKRNSIQEELAKQDDILLQGVSGSSNVSTTDLASAASSALRLQEELNKVNDKIDTWQVKVTKAEAATMQASENVAKSIKKAADEASKELLDKTKAADDAFKNIGSSIASILATVGATKFLKEATQSAGELEKATQRITNLFGALGSEARLAAQEISEAYGMSEKAASQTLGYVGNLMMAYGLSKKEALGLAEEVTKLSADLASFSGGTKTAEQAAQSLSQALLGNYRATRDLGIAITDTEVKLFAKNLGLATDGLNQGELALLRYQVVLDQTKNITHDFAKSQDTFYVATQKANASIQDLKASFGEDFLPMITTTLDAVSAAADAIAGWSPVLKSVVTGAALTIASFTALTTVLKPLITNVAILSASVKAAGGSFWAAVSGANALKVSTDNLTASQVALNAAMRANPILMVVSAIAGLIPIIVTLANNMTDARDPAEALEERIDSLTIALKNYKEAADMAASAKLPGIYEPSNAGSIKAEIQAIADTYQEAAANVADLEREHEEAMAKFEKELLEYSSEISAVREDIEKGGTSYHILVAPLAEERDRVLKEMQEYEKTYESNVDKQKGIMQTAFSALTTFFSENKELISDSLVGYDVLGSKIEKIIELYDRFVLSGRSVNDVLGAMNYDSEDWDKLISKVGDQIDQQQVKRLKNEGEYREALLHSIDALDEEAKVYKQNIDKYAQWNKSLIAATLIDKGASIEEIEKVTDTFQNLFDRVSAGDVSNIEVDLEGISDIVDDESTMLKVKGMFNDLIQYNEWVNKSRIKLQNDYVDEISKSEEDLQSKLRDLMSKSYSTFEEQRDKSLEKQKESYQNYIDEFYGRLGGAKGIMGDGAYTEDLKKAMYEIKKGIEPIFDFDDQENVFRVFVGDIMVEGEEAYKFFQSLLPYLEAFKEGQKNIENEYLLSLRKAQIQENDALLDSRAALTNNLETKYNIEKIKLDEQYELEVIEARRRYSNEEDYQRAVEALNEKYANMSLKNERDFAEQVYEVRKSLADRSKNIARDTVDIWTSSSVVQEGDFLNPIFTSLYELDKEFEDIFENIKSNMEDSLSDLEQVLPEGLGGAVRELIQSVREASSEEDLIDIRGAIDDLIAQIEDPAVREAVKKAFGGLFDQVEQSTEMRVKKLADTIGSSLTNAIKSIDKLLKTFEDNEINIIKERIKAMKEAYDDLKEQMEKRNDKANGRLTRSQKDAIERQKKMDADELERQKALIEEQEDLLKDKQREQFERQKAFSIATATITGIQSAIDAYAGGMAMAKYMGMAAPAATGIAAALAAISMAATAAQIAAISNQQPPSYAQGAYNLPQDQLANVHKGEMIIPKPFAQEIRENGGLSGGEITINVYGATDEVSVEDNSSEGNQQLDIYLTQRVKTMVARGELDNALQTRYSISKNGRMS